jgi:hypothetical protein
MKSIISLLFLLASLGVHAQTESALDSLFIVTYTVGSSWDVTKQPNEQTYFKEHSENLSKLRKQGIIKTGARYGDKGIIVIASKSMTMAKEIILTDVAVINKLFMADIQKLNVFYDGCLERPK